MTTSTMMTISGRMTVIQKMIEIDFEFIKFNEPGWRLKTPNTLLTTSKIGIRTIRGAYMHGTVKDCEGCDGVLLYGL